MKTIDLYEQYMDCLRNGEADCTLTGEAVALQIAEQYHPEGDFAVWMCLNDGRTALLNVSMSQGKAHMSEPPAVIEQNVFADETLKDFLNNGRTQAWWNLCFRKDNDDTVAYDAYYDSLFADDETTDTLLKIRQHAAELLKEMPFRTSVPVFLTGRLSQFHLLGYALQQHVSAPVRLTSATGSVTLDQLNDLRGKYCVSRDGGSSLRIWYGTEKGSSCISLRSGQRHILSLPLDEAILQQLVATDTTYRDIMPTDQLTADYEEGGTSYMTLLLEPVIDIFGHTLLVISDSHNGRKYKLFTQSDSTSSNPQFDKQYGQ